MDRAGVTTFSAALFLLMLALMRGNDEGWGSTLIVSLFAASAVLMAAFVAVEHRVAEPMLPLGLFRRRAFAGVQLAAFAISGSLFALFLYLTLYLQNSWATRRSRRGFATSRSRRPASSRRQSPARSCRGYRRGR